MTNFVVYNKFNIITKLETIIDKKIKNSILSENEYIFSLLLHSVIIENDEENNFFRIKFNRKDSDIVLFNDNSPSQEMDISDFCSIMVRKNRKKRISCYHNNKRVDFISTEKRDDNYSILLKHFGLMKNPRGESVQILVKSPVTILATSNIITYTASDFIRWTNIIGNDSETASNNFINSQQTFTNTELEKIYPLTNHNFPDFYKMTDTNGYTPISLFSISTDKDSLQWWILNYGVGASYQQSTGWESTASGNFKCEYTGYPNINWYNLLNHQYSATWHQMGHWGLNMKLTIYSNATYDLIPQDFDNHKYFTISMTDLNKLEHVFSDDLNTIQMKLTMKPYKPGESLPEKFEIIETEPTTGLIVHQASFYFASR